MLHHESIPNAIILQSKIYLKKYRYINPWECNQLSV
jgi:hypothetical protein